MILSIFASLFFILVFFADDVFDNIAEIIFSFLIRLVKWKILLWYLSQTITKNSLIISAKAKNNPCILARTNSRRG